MEIKFVICTDNEDYQVSLERWKVYQALDDAKAKKYHQIRVIDESGEDYLFPENYFTPINLPDNVKHVWMGTALNV